MKESFEELLQIIKKCRRECPWMKEHTIEKHRAELLSEAHEVAEALDKKDYENLKEELGDLLYDTMLMVELCSEKGLFRAKDVIDGVNAKIKRRKPWVFGNAKVNTPEEAVKMWNEIKKKEKEAGKK